MNNGFIGRNDGTVNFGKQPFVMTDAVMANVLAKIDRDKPVIIYAIGASSAAARQLADYLRNNGIENASIYSIGSWSVSGVDIPDVAVRIGEPAPYAGREEGATPITIDVTK